jgi:hypothetical protein
MANAERVKDVAEADRYGSAAWRARWMTVVAAPTGVFSILFAAWQEPNLFTEEIRAALRSLR